MTPDELRARTKSFALRIVKLYRSLRRTADAQVMGKQLLRCGTRGQQITELRAGFGRGRNLPQE